MIDKKQKGLLIGIGFAIAVTGLVVWNIVSFPKALNEAKQQAENADRLGITNGAVIGNVNVPPTGDAGKFKGKLEQLNLLAVDMPAAFGPYGPDPNTAPTITGYKKNPAIAQEDHDSAQYYSQIPVNNYASYQNGDSPLTQATFSIRTFTDTSSAAHSYAITKTIGQGFREPANQNFAGYNRNTKYYSLPNVGADNVVTKTWDDPKGDSSDKYATRNWAIEILLSNATIDIGCELPYVATDQDFQLVVTNWLKHVDAYQPGTAADVASENAAGY